jgi:uncharacterized protein (DUF362 family)
MEGRKLSRRSFLGSVAGTVASWLAGLAGAAKLMDAGTPGLASGAARAGTIPLPTSRVVIAKDPLVIRKDGSIDTTVLEEMLDAAMEKLHGRSPALAWAHLFSPDDVVGIKVNCLAGKGLSPHPELVDLIARKLMDAGVSPVNIIVWDRTDRDLVRAGFTIARGGSGTRCYGTNDDYDTDEIEIAGSVGSIFSPIIARRATAIVSVPVLKDHDLAGVTLSMKNFYGAIHNPNKYHDNNCTPYVADLNTHRYIRDKLKLIITDALVAQYHGGPSYKPQFAWEYAGLIVARDQVSHDATGWKIIEEKRKEMGIPSLAESKREPRYIARAAELGLGIADPSRIEVVNT